MQALGRRYVRYINDRHHRTGTLWEGRYKACLVDRESYLLHCYRYIELNPVRSTTPVASAGRATLPMRTARRIRSLRRTRRFLRWDATQLAATWPTVSWSGRRLPTMTWPPSACTCSGSTRWARTASVQPSKRSWGVAPARRRSAGHASIRKVHSNPAFLCFPSPGKRKASPGRCRSPLHRWLRHWRVHRLQQRRGHLHVLRPRRLEL